MVSYKTYRRFRWLFEFLGYRVINQQDYYDEITNQSKKNEK